MEVTPTNVYERAYSLLVLMSGLGLFSSFIASISTLMTSLRNMREKQSKEDALVRRYIMEHGVSMELGNRIFYFIRENRRSSKKRRLTEADVKSFTSLPDSMRVDLHWEVFGPVTTRHPLFNAISLQDDNGLREVCHRSMNQRQLGAGNELFHNGQKADRMFLLATGNTEFRPGQALAVDVTAAESTDGAIYVQVIEGRWVAEMVLWMSWLHRGTLTGTQSCELVEVDAVPFHDHVKQRDHCFEMCRRYALYYLERFKMVAEQDPLLGSSFEPGALDADHYPTDIWGTVDDIQDLVHRTTESFNVTPKPQGVDLIKTLFASGWGGGGMQRSPTLTRTGTTSFFAATSSINQEDLMNPSPSQRSDYLSEAPSAAMTATISSRDGDISHSKFLVPPRDLQ